MQNKRLPAVAKCIDLLFAFTGGWDSGRPLLLVRWVAQQAVPVAKPR